MQDGFQAGFGRGVGKNPLPHCRTIQRALRQRDIFAEGGDDFRHGCALCAGQLVGDAVGVDDRHAQAVKEVGNRAFAAADATGQSDDGIHCC